VDNDEIVHWRRFNAHGGRIPMCRRLSKLKESIEGVEMSRLTLNYRLLK